MSQGNAPEEHIEELEQDLEPTGEIEEAVRGGGPKASTDSHPAGGGVDGTSADEVEY